MVRASGQRPPHLITSTGRTWFEPVDSVHPTMVGGCWTDPTPSAFSTCKSARHAGMRVTVFGAKAQVRICFVSLWQFRRCCEQQKVSCIAAGDPVLLTAFSVNSPMASALSTPKEPFHGRAARVVKKEKTHVRKSWSAPACARTACARVFGSVFGATQLRQLSELLEIVLPFRRLRAWAKTNSWTKRQFSENPEAFGQNEVSK